ncbi:hypothetical protein TNCV_1069631 [Trichonephila clavipes]|nr:hypothetical protein TNCV_1069631 [Trichonephila clavipes]
MIPAYNKKRCAAVPFEKRIHFRRKTDFFPEEDTTKSYSGFEPEPIPLHAEEPIFEEEILPLYGKEIEKVELHIDQASSHTSKSTTADLEKKE